MSSHAFAQTMSLDMGSGNSFTGRVFQMMMLITVISLAPTLLVTVTSFTRIVVVFSFLRTAMGLQQSPPNNVIISLALFLTLFIMSPTLEKAYDDGIAPLIAETITESEAFDRTTKPLKEFMLINIREADLEFFIHLSKKTFDAPSAMPLTLVIPAFILSELRRAFEIGFLLFIPFIVIDLLVASILMSMGMMMMPPVMISLPFKLIFFVMVDGWRLVTESLVRGYLTG